MLRRLSLACALLVAVTVPSASAAPLLVFDDFDIVGVVVPGAPPSFDLFTFSADGTDATLGDYVAASIIDTSVPSSSAALVFNPAGSSNELVVSLLPSGQTADLVFNFTNSFFNGTNWFLLGTGSVRPGSSVTDPLLLPFLGDIVAGLSFATNTNNAVIYDLDYVAPAPVPEPATFALFAVAGTAAILYRRRRVQRVQ